jgi:hypothetical protein
MPPPLADANGAKARRHCGRPRIGPTTCLVRLASIFLAYRYTSPNVALIHAPSFSMTTNAATIRVAETKRRTRPVRAAVVEEPMHHQWSSVHANLARCEDALVTSHACFMAMGDSLQMRSEAYRTWINQGVSDNALLPLRQHLKQECSFGSRRSQAMAEKTSG